MVENWLNTQAADTKLGAPLQKVSQFWQRLLGKIM